MHAIDRATLRVYLRDHLTASVAAIRLLERMCDGGLDPPVREELVAITRDVRAEQDVLRGLLRAIGGGRDGPAGVVAWIGERLSRLKLGPGRPGDSGLRQFETLEALSLAFYGRESLWRTLAELDAAIPLDNAIDFAALASRAARHREWMERARLAASARALRVAVTG